MDEREKEARDRDSENRAEFAIGRQEREMARVQRRLERDMDELRDTEERVEHEVEQEWRDERFGHEPEPPPSWPKEKD